MAIHCAAAERGVLIKIKKDSSWVKLKAFLTIVGRPNNCNELPGTYFYRGSLKRAIAIISFVCLSVCHIHDPRLNSSGYRKAFCAT